MNKSFRRHHKGVYRIEKNVKKNKTRSLVKWRGHPESFNTWVDNKDLIKL